MFKETGNRRKASVLIAAVALATTAAADHTPAPASARQVVVDLCDGTGSTPSTLELARIEASKIYAAANVAILWTDGCDQAPGTDKNAARVYLMEDLPKPVRFRFRHEHNKSGIMGYVMTTPGSGPGPVIYVARARLVDKLDDAAEDPMTLGRALGRVIAHELAHRFLQAGHTDKGILKDNFSRGDLVGDGEKLMFSEEQAQELAAVAQPGAH